MSRSDVEPPTLDSGLQDDRVTGTPGRSPEALRDEPLRSDPLPRADLAVRSVRGGTVTIAGQGAQFVLQMASTMILARVLQPKDFGIIAMAIAVTGFAAIFKDLGLSFATVQRSHLTHAQVSALFWINVGLGLAVAAAVAASAPVVAWFYADLRLIPVVVVLSTTFAIGGATVQHHALLQRQMRFKVLAAIPPLSLAVGTAAAVVASLLNLEYWALVIMQIVSTLTNAVVVWIVCRWRPGSPSIGAEVRSMLTFGMHLSGFNILNYFARTLDNILIGKIWGPRALGIYSKAYSLLMFPLRQLNEPVAAVAIPTLSRLCDDPVEYRRWYLTAIRMIQTVTMPGVVFLMLFSDEVVRVLLGPQWTEAGRIFRILAVAGLLQPIANSAGWLYVSQGRTRDLFLWGIIGSSVSIGGILAGLPWGATGVAVGYTAFNAAALPALYWAAGRKGPVHSGHLYKAAVSGIVVCLPVLCVLPVFRLLLHGANDLFTLTAGAVLMVLTTMGSLGLTAGGREVRSDFQRSVGVLVPRHRIILTKCYDEETH